MIEQLPTDASGLADKVRELVEEVNRLAYGLHFKEPYNGTPPADPNTAGVYVPDTDPRYCNRCDTELDGYSCPNCAAQAKLVKPRTLQPEDFRPVDDPKPQTPEMPEDDTPPQKGLPCTNASGHVWTERGTCRNCGAMKREPQTPDMTPYIGLLCEFGWQVGGKIDRLEPWVTGNSFTSKNEGLHWSECRPTPEAETIVRLRQIAREHRATRSDIKWCLKPLEEKS